MSDDGGYELQPAPPRPTPPSSPSVPETSRPKPGDPGWTPPVPIIEKANPADSAADSADETPPDPDVQQNKGLAVLGYICFVIPLVAAPNSPFARYHANQGLLSLLALMAATLAVIILQVGGFVLGLILSRIALLAWFFSCGIMLLSVALLVGWVALVIQGILHAAGGEKKPLPVIGHWTLIK